MSSIQQKFLLFICVSTGLAFAAAAEPKGESRFLSNTRQLIFSGRRSGEGYFSPDGKSLTFQSEREPGNPFYQIYTLDLIHGDIRRVSTGTGKTTCSFFRPGTDEILFASTHEDPETLALQKAELDFRSSGKERRYSWDYDEHYEIYSARRDGTNLKRLTDARGYDAEASYSPDGKKIVFTSIRDAYPPSRLSDDERKRLETDPSYFAEIYIMDADGSDPRRLTHTPGYDGGPFFTPDGKRIVWRRFDEKGVTADVYTMKTDGSDVRRLTDFGSMSWAPYFHPSSRYLIFTANKLGFSNFELFLVDAAGEKEPVRVTFTDGFDGLPVFSPDGKKLCWTSARTPEGNSQLFMADWDHNAALAAIKSAPPRGVTNTQSVVATPKASKPQKIELPKISPLNAEITERDLRSEIGFLASDALAGRQTGTDGARLAADFLAENLRKAGLKPAINGTNYFQDFDFTSGVKILTNANHLTITAVPIAHSVTNAVAPASTRGARTALPLPGGEGRGEGDPMHGLTRTADFTVEKDFRPLSLSSSGETEGEVVFAGYGLVVPGKPGEGYDSYAGLDVSNKVVLVLRYVPEGVEPKRRQELNRYASLRYKALVARERGARALLVVTGPNSPNAGQLIPLTFDTSLAGSGIIAASVNTFVADRLLDGTGKDLKTLQTSLDTENPHLEVNTKIPGAHVKISTALEQIKSRDHNILALLPPAKGVTEYIMVGAHYDHLGHGESGSLERSEEAGQIHHGADDNASGSATVLELAASLAAEQKRNPKSMQRGILFAFWSGEEIGLIGSSWFTEHPVIPLTNIVAYVNFDMVGRLRDNKLSLQGVGSSPVWRRLAEKENLPAGFNLSLQGDPYLPTDVTAFYPKQVPVINFFTGSHEDYHRPTDTADKINYPGLLRIAQFARDLVRDLATDAAKPEYSKVQQSSSAGGSRETLRIYIGSIPDYTAEVAGVKLSGVRGGSPAEKGGLKGGDVIVEFGGQKIANIYDYTFALDAVKIGQPVSVIIQRDGQRLTLSVTPEARK